MNNIELLKQVFWSHPAAALVVLCLVFLPIAGWILIFSRKKEQSWRVLALTFLAGIGSAVIMFAYQYFWEKNLDFGFFELTPVNFQQNIGGWVRGKLLSVFLVALSIGFIEEYLKHWVVKKTDQRYFRAVNDIVILSIVAALGFAFTENLIYLFRELNASGFSGKFFSLFILRSLFVVFVHILCSGIYGYFYGVGYYAAPVLEETAKTKRVSRIPTFLHRLIHFKKERVFADEMMTLGLIISTGVHGFFDFFMSVNWTLGGILGIQSLETVGIHVIILPLYLFGGLWYLWHIFEQREHQMDFGRRMVKEIYVERDLGKNLAVLQEYETSMTKNYQRREQKNKEVNFGKNVELLQKYEKTMAQKYKAKEQTNKAENLGKNLELLQKYEAVVEKKYKAAKPEKTTTPEDVMKNLKKMQEMEETIKKHYSK